MNIIFTKDIELPKVLDPVAHNVETRRNMVKAIPNKPPKQRVIKVSQNQVSKVWYWQLLINNSPAARSSITFPTVAKATENAIEVFPEIIVEV